MKYFLFSLGGVLVLLADWTRSLVPVDVMLHDAMVFIISRYAERPHDISSDIPSCTAVRVGRMIAIK